MKKKVVILLLTVCIVLLTSCFNKTPNYYKYDTFFLEETLTTYHLDNLPVLNANNSALNNDENILYLNLTKEEFDDYIVEVLNYIIDKENVYYKGIHYENQIYVGPLWLPLNVKVIIPLLDNTDLSKKGECFVFSLKDELNNGWISNSMSDVFYVELIYEESKLEDIDFSYTCYISIGSIDYAQYETCAKSHKYSKEYLSYPVPNTNIIIDVYSCEYCGNEHQSDYYGGNDYTSYSKVITKGFEYVESECYQKYLVNPTCFAGLKEHIKIKKVEDAQYCVTVNGFNIPVLYEEDDYLIYGYIVPMCDVNVEISKIV